MKKLASALVLLLSSACAHRPPFVTAEVDYVEVDLLRSHPESEKIYVQARLEDGGLGLFMVDTGAGISAITSELADRLGIQGQATGRSLQGLGGEAPLIQGRLATLQFEGLELQDIDVAVGVPGIPSHAGWMPIDGILGNNVWGQLVLGIDYPANVLEISRPGVRTLPEEAQDIYFDGRHVVVETVVVAGSGEESIARTLRLELDTGARGLLLSGDSGQGFESIASEGEEPIFGVGASEDVPVSAFYRRTRHVPLREIHLGGQHIADPPDAVWINYDGRGHLGPRDLTGLVGHHLLKNHHVLLDFQARKLLLLESEREARPVNGHQTLLAQDRKRFGNAKERGLFRAQMHLASDEFDLAKKELQRFLRKHPDHPEAVSLLSRIHRSDGDLDAYFQTLLSLEPKGLAEAGELVGAVVTLLLNDREQDAIALATKAEFTAPDEVATHLALFEIHMHLEKHQHARENLLRAMILKENPDAFLMRRSRLSLTEGDHYGTATLLRRRLALYPSDGFALWAYGLSLPESTQAVETFRQDMERAHSRLHQERLPLDFAAASHLILADEEHAATLMAQGIERDCETADLEGDAANCEAWYLAMANERLDEALEKATKALSLDPHRPDYLDTLAVVHWRLGDVAAAEAAAREAVRLSPSDTYHLWQLDRIRVIQTAPSSTP